MRWPLLSLALTVAGLAPPAAQAAPGCALVVHVVDEAGKPAAGVTVRVKIGEERQEGTTAESGAAEFTAIPCGEAAIEAGEAQGSWFQVWAGTSRTLRPDLPSVAQLVVAARTQVTIRVLDQGGQPIVSGEVWGASAAENRPLGSPVRGSVTVLLQPGSWRFHWKTAGEDMAPGRTFPGKWAEQFGGGTTVEVGRQPITVDLVIRNRTRVVARIHDPDGKPIEGVQVFARDPGNGDFLAAAQPFADGLFALDLMDLPAVIEPVAFQRSISFDPPRMQVQEASQEPLLFVGRPSTRPVLHGRVVRKDTGAPVADVWVQVKPDCGGTVPQGLVYADIADVTVKTTPTGDFEARCAPECPFRARTMGASRNFPTGACEQEVLLEIEEKPVWVLEGTVTDRKGTPLEGLPINTQLYGGDSDESGSWVLMGGLDARTGEDGSFRIEGDFGGRYRLQVNSHGALKAHRDLVLVDKRAPGTRFEFTLEPEDDKRVAVRAVPGATLCVRAVDAKNVPTFLPGFTLFAEVDDVALENSDLGTGVNEGRICLEGIVPGRYRVRVGDKGGMVPVWYPGSEDRAEAVAVSLSSGMHELEPVVLRPAGKLSLTLPGWSVSELPRIEYREPLPQDAAPEAEPPPWSAVPDERVQLHEGAFAVPFFPAGSWELRACAAPRCGEAFWRTTKPLEVAGYGAAKVSLEPPPPPPPREEPAEPAPSPGS